MTTTEPPWEVPHSRFHFGKPHRLEADHLSKCVLERAPSSDWAREFIEHRFRFPLSNYRDRSTTSAGVHIAINLLSAAFGLATAAIVAAGGDSDFWKAMVIAIGLAVGVLSGVNQILQPGQRNLTYARTWIELRAQGWQYVWGLGDYAPLPGDDTHTERKMWDLFVTRVINAQQDAEKIAEPGGEVITDSTATARARGGTGKTQKEPAPDDESGRGNE